MDAEIVDLVLLELAAYSSNVRTLQLNEGEHATLSQLPYTCFDEYTFHYESMIVLLAELRSCRTVTCLEFSNCTIMAERTVDLFIEHLRSGRSSIQEHHLRPAVPDDPAHCNPFNEPSEPVDWNLLRTQQCWSHRVRNVGGIVRHVIDIARGYLRPCSTLRFAL
jgi:hypothetical protein